MASDAAASHCVSLDKAQPILLLIRKMALIQNRIIAVIKMFPQRPYSAKTIKPNPVSITPKIYNASRLSSHNLIKTDNRLVCTTCNSSVSFTANFLFDFMSSKCIPEDKFVSLAIGK